MARTSATPKPVVTKTVCSLCGLDWEKHPENASAVDCIDLLKAEVATPHPVVWPNPTITIAKRTPQTWEESPMWTQPRITCGTPHPTGTISGGSETAARY